MKECSRCGELKEKSLFQKRKASKDGLTAACKSCLKIYDDSRLKNPKRVKARREYQKTEKGKAAHKKACINWLKNNTVKRAAHILVGNAVRKGQLIKKPCEICGDEKVNAHHDDYAFPLSVRWLCDNHHAEWHKNNGEGKNAR